MAPSTAGSDAHYKRMTDAEQQIVAYQTVYMQILRYASVSKRPIYMAKETYVYGK